MKNRLSSPLQRERIKVRVMKSVAVSTLTLPSPSVRERGIILPLIAGLLLAGCTVKAVGDPNRPITINANVVVDIRGLKQTASNIEDMVAQGGSK